MSRILKPTEENMKLAARSVVEGGIIIAPSDTNMALTLNPWSDIAIERAFAIKKRPATSPLTLFFLEPNEWKEYGKAEDAGLVQAFVDAFWPGPLNIILNRKASVPDRLVCGGPTVSMGCLRNPVWRGLAHHARMPLAMTSANLSGRANGVLVDLSLAVEQIGDQVDYILEGGALDTTKSSTILDLSGAPRILRYGDICADQLNQVAQIFSSPQPE